MMRGLLFALFALVSCAAQAQTANNYIEQPVWIDNQGYTRPPITTLPTGGATPAYLADVIADTDRLRSFCYVGDGASHKLTTLTKCGSTPVAGWTLQDFQLRFPCVTSLLDEADRVALQCAINAVPTGGTINLPFFGTAYIDKGLVVSDCTASLFLYGTGTIKSVINQATAGEKGLTVCPTKNGTGAVNLRNVSFGCIATSADCGDAVTLSATESTVAFSDVRGGSRRWATGWYLTSGGGNTFWRANVYMGAEPNGITGSCFKQDTPPSGFSVVTLVYGSHFYSCAKGVEFTTSAGGAGVEGVRFHNVDIDRALQAFVFHMNGAAYKPPEYVFDTIQTSFFQSVFSVDGTTGGMSSIVVDKSWFIQLAPDAGSGAVTASDIVNFGTSLNVTFTHNQFQQAAGAAFNWFLNIPSTGVGYVVAENIMGTMLGTINNGLMNIQSGAKQVLERANNWNYAGVRVVNGAPTEQSVISYDWLDTASSHKCGYSGYDLVGTLTTSRITCSDVATLVTDASSQVTVNYPITFALSQWPVATLVGLNCSNQPLSINTATTTSFIAKLNTCGAGITVNISYSIRSR